MGRTRQRLEPLDALRRTSACGLEVGLLPLPARIWARAIVDRLQEARHVTVLLIELVQVEVIVRQDSQIAGSWPYRSHLSLVYARRLHSNM